MLYYMGYVYYTIATDEIPILNSMMTPIPTIIIIAAADGNHIQ